MTEREMIINILNRLDAHGYNHDILHDGTVEIYGAGYNRSINIEFNEQGEVIDIC